MAKRNNSYHTIRLENISKTYGDDKQEVKVEALKNIYLNFETNKIYAIMGPSGSGKSTLMHILGLLDRPSGGRYFLEDENISTLSDARIAHLRSRRIGFVFQSFNLLPRYSVFKNVELPMIYSNEHLPAARKRIIDELLEKVGLTDRAHHKPTELSGGQKQRVAIARSLVNDPALILADEPTGNLDTHTEREIMDLFVNLKNEQRTIILVTHDDTVAEYADEIVVIRDGEVE